MLTPDYIVKRIWFWYHRNRMSFCRNFVHFNVVQNYVAGADTIYRFIRLKYKILSRVLMYTRPSLVWGMKWNISISFGLSMDGPKKGQKENTRADHNRYSWMGDSLFTNIPKITSLNANSFFFWLEAHFLQSFQITCCYYYWLSNSCIW